METDGFHIFADQGDICELLRPCQSCQLLLKRGKGSLLSADLVILHLFSLLYYCGVDHKVGFAKSDRKVKVLIVKSVQYAEKTLG